NSPVTLTNNVIVSNTGYYGYGVWLEASPATLSGNTISHNEVVGVWLYNSPASLNSNIVSQNMYGIFLIGSPSTLTNNDINNNTYLFAVHLDTSDSVFANNRISNNAGNGIDVDVGVVTLTNNLISYNLCGVCTSYAYLTLESNIIGNNRGRGV